MAENTQEVWEVTNESTVWVHVKDPRVPGGWSQKRVGGRGTKKVTLTVEEREFNQELISEEYQHLDPFTNGIMIRTHPKTVTRGEYELTDDDLVTLLRAEGDEDFEKVLKSIESEVVVRRIFALAEKHATVTRYNVIQSLIDQRYRIGKTSKVVKEIIEDDVKYADADL